MSNPYNFFPFEMLVLAKIFLFSFCISSLYAQLEAEELGNIRTYESSHGHIYC